MRIIVFIVFTYLCMTNAFAQNPTIKHGHLKVDGIYLKDKNNEKVTLRGVTYGWSNENFHLYNASTVKWLKKDWKVSIIRATMGIEPAGGYLDAPINSINYVSQVIDAAIKNNIYVVIAWHCNNMHLSQSKDFFSEIAKKYGKYPNIIYEIFTEPDDETWSDLKPYYSELIQTIRSNDPENIILLSAPYWSQHIREVADDPLTGFNNIMYTVHFCVGASGEELRNDCEYALQKNTPIIVTDHLLTDCSCDGKIYTDEWEKWISWFEKNSISWVVWSISDKKENCSLLMPKASVKGNWNDSELKESEKVVRKRIIELNTKWIK